MLIKTQITHFHKRTKHIHIQYHYVREAMNDGTIAVTYCPTKLMVADCLTNALSKEKFEELRGKLGLQIMY